MCGGCSERLLSSLKAHSTSTSGKRVSSRLHVRMSKKCCKKPEFRHGNHGSMSKGTGSQQYLVPQH